MMWKQMGHDDIPVFDRNGKKKKKKKHQINPDSVNINIRNSQKESMVSSPTVGKDHEVSSSNPTSPNG